MKKILYPVLIVMLVLTVFGISDLSDGLFAGIGANYTTRIVRAPIVFPILFFSLFVCVSFFSLHKHVKTTLQLISFLFWILSGQMVGFKSFPKISVVSGWYGFPLTESDICVETNRQINYSSKWYVTTLIAECDVRTEIFLGPFLFSKTMNFVENHPELIH